VEVSQLRSLIDVARAGSFRQAAQARHISQPSISEQIRRLERELNIVIFDRSRRPVELTEPGRLLLGKAQLIIAAVDDVVAELQDFDAGCHGRVSVGAVQYLTHLELPKLLAAFQHGYPEAELSLRVANSGEIVQLLLDNRIDVALIHARPDGLPERIALSRLRPVRLVVVCGIEDPLLRHKPADLSELADAPFIIFREGAVLRDVLLAATTRAGFSPRRVLESADIATAMTLVASGCGVALVPAQLARDQAARIGLLPLRRLPQLELVVAWDSERYQSKAARAFVELSRNFLR
jgi:DNA-binding transcriptional LysR family regulator